MEIEMVLMIIMMMVSVSTVHYSIDFECSGR